MKNRNCTNARLLGHDDPPAITRYNSHYQAPVILICEHAGNHVPQRLNHLGLTQEDLQSHISWDIGAQALAMQISDTLQLPLILQQYSRLVIDCNRPPGSPGSIVPVSDGIHVPGNIQLDSTEVNARQAEIFVPYDQAIQETLASRPHAAGFSIHSFTPRMQGIDRPWHAGFLARKDTDTARKLMEHIAATDPQRVLALNQPYQIEEGSDWFIPHYAEAFRLKHTLIEVRNDQLHSESGVALWADLISRAIGNFLKEYTA